MAKASLDNQLESVVGNQWVLRETDLTIDGLKPQLIVRPASAEEAVECLKVCAERGAAVVPAGRRAWLECGNPLRRADAVLSLERMSRVIEYSPPDLTATVEAGVCLSDFNALARRERQWLPLDPSGARSATIGAVAACASFGPLRLGAGTPRDYVIGLRLAHADGSQSRSGGKVVKNVAGYDMNKLYIGSFGTLALITELTLKLRPLAESISTVVVTAKTHGALASVARRVLDSELQPVSIFITEGVATDSNLAIRFAANEAAVRYQIDYVMGLLDSACNAQTLDESEAEDFWTSVADIDLRAAVAIRVSIPLSQAYACFERMLSLQPHSVAVADLGTGIIRMAFEADDDEAVRATKKLCAESAAMGGALIIERARTEVRRQADAWGEAGPAVELMKSIKAKFDPRSLLSPGRFVAGI